MSKTREALEAALEVLEQLQGGCTDSDDGTVEVLTVWCPEIIEQIQAALAEPEQEPVYQLQTADGSWIDQAKHSHDYNVKHGNAKVRILYTSPIHSRQSLSKRLPPIFAREPFEKAVDEYPEEYEFYTDEGVYAPSEYEKYLIKDAIMGLPASPEIEELLSPRPREWQELSEKEALLVFETRTYSNGVKGYTILNDEGKERALLQYREISAALRAKNEVKV